MRPAHASALVALLLACACTDGAVDAGTAETAVATETVSLGCSAGALLATPAGSLLNNQWNAASAGPGPWTQCLHSRLRPDGTTEYGWSWNWPARDGLYAFPEILIGSSPWTDTPSNDPRFPRTVAETPRLQVAHDIESQLAGKSNLALEFWLTDPTAPLAANGRAPVKAELMIWSDESDGLIPPDDKPVGSVDIDGMKWTVYLHRDWGDASVAGGVGGGRWAYIAYHAERRSRTAGYDARKFIDDAIARGVIAPTDRIAGVELGNEVVSGSGTSWIRRFALDLR